MEFIETRIASLEGLQKRLNVKVRPVGKENSDLPDLSDVNGLVQQKLDHFNEMADRLPEIDASEGWKFNEITDPNEIDFIISKREDFCSKIGIRGVKESRKFDPPDFGGNALDTIYFGLYYKGSMSKAVRLIKRDNGLDRGSGVIPLDLTAMINEEVGARVKPLLNKYSKKSTYELSGFVGFPHTEGIETKGATISLYCMADALHKIEAELSIYTQHPTHARVYETRTGLPYLKITKTHPDHNGNPAVTLGFVGEVFRRTFSEIKTHPKIVRYLEASEFKPRKTS